MKRAFLVGLLISWLVGWSALSVAAQDAAGWQSQADYTFGQALTFELAGKDTDDLAQATLFFKAANLPSTFTVELEPADELSHTVDLTQLRLAPFSAIDYWWRLTTKDGAIIDVPAQTLIYADNQFAWQEMAQDDVIVHWTGDDPALGQVALDVVAEALPNLQAIIPVAESQPLRIYIYPTSADLRAALRLTGQDWIGAHAHPELGVILVTAVNSRTAAADLRRSIPHELVHFLLYQAAGASYEQMPLWFNEGLATYLETTPNPNYALLLETAVAEQNTIPLEQLCYSFPTDANTVLLAYAQSGSVITYIQDRYGNQAVTDLITAHADGADCETAVARTLNLSLNELQQDWLASIHPPSFWQQYGLWLLLLAGGFAITALLVIIPK